ncbi:MAG TPA: EI24 domain-containing protein [Pelomicrobium sp.]|nr:EI24 domain-containing protein [Pelomicrobium sp.]
MSGVPGALAAGFRSLLSPRMLTLAMWPILTAVGGWLVLSWLLWDVWLGLFEGLIAASPMRGVLTDPAWGWVPESLGFVFMVVFLIPAIWLTALAIAAVFQMPAMLNHVAQRHYPALERKHGGTFAGSVWNALAAIGVVAVLWLVTLPLWLFGPLGLVVPILIAAYVNQRLFRYDALAEHASAEEFKAVLARAKPRVYVLSALAGLVQFVPIVNLLGPIFIGLVFIHFFLRELAALRAQPGAPR